MIVREEGTVELACDECGEGSGAYHEDDFATLINETKSAGFVTRRVGYRSFENFCARCAESLWTETRP